MHARKSQTRARVEGQQKESKINVGSFSAFQSSWGSPWSVSRQEPKEACLAFRGGSGRWFWLGFGSGVWTSYENAGDASQHRFAAW